VSMATDLRYLKWPGTSFLAQQRSASQEDCSTMLVLLVGNSFGSRNKSWEAVIKSSMFNSDRLS
jgi:hypothetical protein